MFDGLLGFRVGCFCLVASSSLLGQTDSVIRVTVNQVRIDATVTDSKGSLVRDLQRDDFQVYQDGKLPKLAHVEYVAGPAPSPLASTQPHELTAAEVNREIVMLVDDVGMSFETFAQARAALKKYLDKGMERGDLVAILRTSRSSSFLDQFTSDPARLRTNIDQMRWHSSSFVFPPVMTVLRSIEQSLGKMPGRKMLILLAEGLQMTDESTGWFRRMADLAVRSGVRIYGVDARGLVTDPGQRVIPASARSSPDPGNRAMRRIYDALEPAVPPGISSGPGDPLRYRPDADNSGLAFLADETGGQLLENSNDIGGRLRKLLDDQSGYYLISWDPGEKAFRPAKGSFADYHQIKVKLLRAGLTVRTPRGFYGFDNSGGLRPGESPKLIMQEALLAPFQDGQMNVQMNSSFVLEDGRPFIRSFVHVAGSDIVFTPRGDGAAPDCHIASLEFLTLPQPIDSHTENLMESQITSLEVCGANYQTMSHDGLAVTMMHPVEKPGAYQMRLAVRNAAPDVTSAAHSLPHAPKKFLAREELAAAVGSAHELVSIPDWRSTSSVVGLQVQAEKQAKSAVPPPDPSPSDKKMTIAYRPALGGDPAIRRFQPGDKLQYDVRVQNVINAELKLRIARPDSDAEVYSTGVGSVHDGPVRGSYMIGEAMTPGPYLFQVEVTGKNLKGQPYRRVEEIDFSVGK